MKEVYEARVNNRRYYFETVYGAINYLRETVVDIADEKGRDWIIQSLMTVENDSTMSIEYYSEELIVALNSVSISDFTPPKKGENEIILALLNEISELRESMCESFTQHLLDELKRKDKEIERLRGVNAN